ncbi:hypothetical protein LCGC14_0632070 [marine sediment metagenome]|uniref:Fibronectin type-III domain-containing protein n=1 Tax=marine sediment metagenome TaxID=412755 RepID=A0A0F9RL09_9ZZZZ
MNVGQARAPMMLFIHGATLHGTLNSDEGEAADCGFEYGLTDGYGTSTPTQSRVTGQTFSQVLTGLLSNTLYHFRSVGTHSGGAGYGYDATFKTF